MNRVLHVALIVLSALLGLGALSYLLSVGISYYSLPIEERFFHPLYEILKPSGMNGHAYGLLGTLLMLIGLFSYMARKRLRILWTWGLLKYWLEAHMVFCTLGTLLIIFHTTFKFGGIISIGFWSLLLVWFSGLIGRFFYTRIPQNIEGKLLDLKEVRERINLLEKTLNDRYGLDEATFRGKSSRNLKRTLSRNNLQQKEIVAACHLFKEERYLKVRVKRLDVMKRLFNRWHYAHVPFALIVQIFLVIHVVVVIYLGYTWIF